ncbi:hypothetical protein BKA70DRAFT_1413477 [Coprinopsis sp. MPI-PUGE-AT-0042]|nr:hypothetical protein BKA70DRAFT_1413477 [Coprinopsis sp. MPI-PUGE-AT-0042]
MLVQDAGKWEATKIPENMQRPSAPRSGFHANRNTFEDDWTGRMEKESRAILRRNAPLVTPSSPNTTSESTNFASQPRSPRQAHHRQYSLRSTRNPRNPPSRWFTGSATHAESYGEQAERWWRLRFIDAGLGGRKVHLTTDNQRVGSESSKTRNDHPPSHTGPHAVKKHSESNACTRRCSLPSDMFVELKEKTFELLVAGDRNHPSRRRLRYLNISDRHLPCVGKERQARAPVFPQAE